MLPCNYQGNMINSKSQPINRPIMIGKGNKLYSIFTSTCPSCHEGKMYKNKNPYALGSVLDMHENCPHCGTKFKIEPSFSMGPCMSVMDWVLG